MVTDKTIEQARSIAMAGRKLKSRMFAIQARVCEECAPCKGEELSVAQMHTLMTVQGCGESTITNLAVLLGVSPPSASCMVDRLVDKGFLHRERSRKDRRKVVVHLSEQAVKHMQKMEEAVLATFVELVEKVGPETAEKWCEVFARVDEVLAAGEQCKVRDDA